MKTKKDTAMKDKVAERVKKEEAERIKKEQAERKKQDIATAVKKLEISDDDLIGYLNEETKGDAKLYCRLYRGMVVYVNYWDRFLIWDRHRWIENDYNIQFQIIGNICKLYMRVAENKQQEADEETEKDLKISIQKIADMAFKRVKSLCKVQYQNDLITMILRIPEHIIVLPKDIDTNHFIKACINGVIDLRTGELHQGKPEEYLLKSIETEFDPALMELADPCPETNKFLLNSMDGDQTLVDFIWRLLGYGLTTERKDHIFTIFWGEHGRNGKDTLIKLVTHVLGKKMSGDVPVEMFLQMQQSRNPSAPSPDIMALHGMCIAWINEAEENQRFALARLKKLTGGSYITGRGLLDKLQTTWIQTHLPIMTTNELPKAKSDDAAFWARAVIVKWPLSFVDDPQQPYERLADKHLEDKLKAESKGVLARIVQGSMEYLRDGLKIPDKVKNWTKEQREKWDDVGQFINEWCILEPHIEGQPYTTSIPAGDLHEAFCIWYAENKDKRFSVSAKKFAEQLEKKNIPQKRSNGSKRIGIILNTTGREALETYRAKR